MPQQKALQLDIERPIPPPRSFGAYITFIFSGFFSQCYYWYHFYCGDDPLMRGTALQVSCSFFCTGRVCGYAFYLFQWLSLGSPLLGAGKATSLNSAAIFPHPPACPSFEMACG